MPSQRRFAGGPIVAWDRMVAGLGLHVGQIKLFVCFSFFCDFWTIIFRKFIHVQTHMQIKPKEDVPDLR